MTYLLTLEWMGLKSFAITREKPPLGYYRETCSKVVAVDEIGPNAFTSGLAEILRDREIVMEDHSDKFCYGEGISA